MIRWKGDESFLNSGRTYWSEDHCSRQLITWSFVKYENTFMPFHFYACTLESQGIKTVGTASSDIAILAARKALAEAWERLWVMKMSGDNATIRSSNGFAAGETMSDAASRSRSELLERAIFLEAWHSRKGWKAIWFRVAKNRLLAMSLWLRGWKTYLFEISSNVGKVIACLLVNQRNGAVFDVRMVDEESDAESLLLYSVIRSSFTANRATKDFELPFDGKPEDHSQYYADVRNLGAFEFLTNLVNRGRKDSCELVEIQLDDIDEIRTTSVVSVGSLPAVAFSQNPKWGPLTWGKASIRGANPWPHPLA